MNRIALIAMLALGVVYADTIAAGPPARSNGASCCAGEIAFAATCVGASPCLACKNCSRCRYCNAGGKCGVCEKAKEKRKYPLAPQREGGTDADPPARNRVAEGLIADAWDLQESGERGKALEVYGRVGKRYPGSAEAETAELLARLLRER